MNLLTILLLVLLPVNPPKRTNIRNTHGQTIGYRTTEIKQGKVITTDTYKDHKVITTTKGLPSQNKRKEPKNDTRTSISDL